MNEDIAILIEYLDPAQPTPRQMLAVIALESGTSISGPAFKNLDLWNASGTDAHIGREQAGINLEWFGQIHSGAAQPAPAKAMIACYVGVQELVRTGNYSTIDTLLAGADVNKLPPEAIVGLLRYSAASKQRLAQWHVFLEKAKAELPKRGFDYRKTLAGLIKSDDPQ